jgi:hypothetical protein
MARARLAPSAPRRWLYTDFCLVAQPGSELRRHATLAVVEAAAQLACSEAELEAGPAAVTLPRAAAEAGLEGWWQLFGAALDTQEMGRLVACVCGAAAACAHAARADELGGATRLLPYAPALEHVPR